MWCCLWWLCLLGMSIVVDVVWVCVCRFLSIFLLWRVLSSSRWRVCMRLFLKIFYFLVLLILLLWLFVFCCCILLVCCLWCLIFIKITRCLRSFTRAKFSVVFCKSILIVVCCIVLVLFLVVFFFLYLLYCLVILCFEMNMFFEVFFEVVLLSRFVRRSSRVLILFLLLFLLFFVCLCFDCVFVLCVLC